MMATIKLTGFNTSTGRSTTAGDNDTVDLSGSLTVGNADTDAVVFNAEIDSDFIPDDDVTYDLGSDLKKWNRIYANEVNAKLRHVNTAKYTESAAVQRYVRWDAAGGNETPGVNNKFVAPANGTLVNVVIRATNVSNSTQINFHKASDGTEDLNTTATETQTVNMASANTSYLAQFTSSSFNAGDILGISLTPTNGFGNVNISCVWLLDWNA